MTTQTQTQTQTQAVGPVRRHRGLRPRVARAVATRIMDRIPVRVELPDGSVVGRTAAHDAPAIQVVRPEAFFARLGERPKIGFGEAYMAGDWRPAPGTDLGVALTPFAERIATAVPRPPALSCSV